MAALRRALGALRVGVRGRSAGPGGALALPRAPLGADPHPEEPMAVAQRKNPDYHGFSAEPDADVLNMRAVFFTGISLAIVLGSVFLHYVPDYGLQQWARRGSRDPHPGAGEEGGCPSWTPTITTPLASPCPPPRNEPLGHPPTPPPDPWDPMGAPPRPLGSLFGGGGGGGEGRVSPLWVCE
ncbi:NADH dehydrogenase [ubiquinone] 1 beta subcomplex subunit 11, mitochondrial [Larus michahellis]|uniref:NADH dehydrogenase [ubiquinone] 1 beta subcomplex subunit 11, mitochondrial n=1 Tax=Larus michahellis TaxID=119627 RepID=UPI003D9ACCFA